MLADDFPQLQDLFTLAQEQQLFDNPGQVFPPVTTEYTGPFYFCPTVPMLLGLDLTFDTFRVFFSVHVKVKCGVQTGLYYRPNALHICFFTLDYEIV